jgi:hypothetical protein
MGNKKQKLSKVKKNRGNVLSFLNWQTHPIQKTVSGYTYLNVCFINNFLFYFRLNYFEE